ncbi:four helix bundle protein [bacterium]|nr:four helix bundle protein [bacterium]
MATFQRFEDIEAWQKARELTKAVYSCSNTEPFCKDYTLKDRIRRASVSVMSNIAEGFERNGTGEFIHFLTVAKGSVGEVKSQFYVAFDHAYITKEYFEILYELASSTEKLIAGLMHYLKKLTCKGAEL